MIEQRSEEWHDLRAGKITCSSFADVMARTQKKERTAAGKMYLLKTALQRVSGKSTPVFETWQMRQGTEREPAARRIYEYRSGYKVEQVGFITHPEYPMVGGSPDGLCGELGGVELKCPELEQHMENLIACNNGVLPEKYQAQIQGLMWVTGRTAWDWCSFNPDFPEHLEFCCLRVQRDDEFILGLEHQVRLFDAEVNIICDDLMKMNGGPVPPPVRLRDLSFDGSEWKSAIQQVGDFSGWPLPAFNDDFNPESWIYQRSELHHDGQSYHIFKRGDVVAVAVASPEWVEANKL